MGRSRHRDALPTSTRAVIAALAVSSVMGLGLVAFGSGAFLRVGLVVCVLLAAGACVVAIATGRRAVSVARAEVSRERAARNRQVEQLQRRLLEVQDAGRVLSARLDREGARIAGLRADVARWQRDADVVRPTLVFPLVAEAMARTAPVPLARVRVRIEDAEAVAIALAPRVPAEPSHPIEPAVDLSILDAQFVETQILDAELVEAPVVEVLGEFSLIGLAAFPRPAGMPDPGLPLIAPPTVVDLTADEVIDVRTAASRVEQTGA